MWHLIFFDSDKKYLNMDKTVGTMKYVVEIGQYYVSTRFCDYDSIHAQVHFCAQLPFIYTEKEEETYRGIFFVFCFVFFAAGYRVISEQARKESISGRISLGAPFQLPV